MPSGMDEWMDEWELPGRNRQMWWPSEMKREISKEAGGQVELRVAESRKSEESAGFC